MAAQGRLAKILEQEYKTRGFVAGSLTGGGKRLREILDLRNVLFSGGGIGSTIGKKIFGKGYSAVSDSGVSKISSPMVGFSKESIEILSSIKSDTRTSAKNSMILPAMARDMNVMRQNIVKMVKLSGGDAATKADAFFLKAKERESAYESQFNRTTPTNISEKSTESKKGSILGGLAGLIGLMLPAISGALKLGFQGLKSIFNGITSSIGALASTVSSIGESVLKLAERVAAITLGKTALDALTPKPPTPPSPKPKPSLSDAVKKRGSSLLGGAAAAGSALSAAGAVRGRSTSPSSVPKPSQKLGNTKPGGLTIGGQQPKTAGKFAQFLSKVESKLIKKHGKKVAASVVARIVAAVGGVFVPGPGWIWTVLSLASLAWFAYDIYEIYKEVFGDDKSPTNLKQEQQLMSNLIYDRFREAGFSDVQARGAVANAVAESRLDPNAHNNKGEDSVGLFQINRNGPLGKGYSVEQLKDPETNIKIAIEAAKKSPLFNKATNIEEATSSFMKQVENPADQSEKAIQGRVNIAQGMLNTNLGSKVNAASVDVAAAQRTSGSGQSNVVVQQDNSVKNVQNSSTGPVASTFNEDWNNLMVAAV